MHPLLKEKGRRAPALCLAILLLVPGKAAPLTPAGTVITHSFTARFGPASPPQSANSNQTQVAVKDFTDPTIVPPRSAATPAGQPIDFLHTISNRGNSADSFQLRASLLQGLPVENGGAPKMQFFAADGKTLLPEDAAGVQLIGPIAPGASLDLVLRVTPLPGSEGSVETIAVKAVSMLFPSRNASLSNQLLVPALARLAAPVKAVAPAGAVLPGTMLTYSIALANDGPAPITGVRVSDRLDALLEYQEGSVIFPAALTGAASYDAASRTLSLSIPSMPAGFSGNLAFRARVRPDAAANSSILNAAGLSSDADGTPVPSNSTLTTVLGPALRVSKQAGSAVAEAGDVVSFTVQVENIGAAALTQLTLADKLPRGFRYLKGSSLLDGLRIADPAGAGQQLSWNVGTLEAGAVRRLGYRCAVGSDVPVGASVNWAAASGITPTGTSSVSPPASAVVKIRPSILGDKAIILGRLFEDRNGNGVPDPGEPGAPGVRVYLEDGSFVFSDREGQYSFTGVSAGNHVVKIDRSTLSPRLKPAAYNTAFAGVGWSQFVTVPFGGPARGDFALAAKEPAEDAETGLTGLTGGQTGQTGQTAPLAAAREQLSDWIMVGIGSLDVGGKAVSGRLEKIDKDDRFEQGIYHEERLAFFTRGKILGKYLLTAAYDSDKERRDGVFQAIDPEKYYPVYGDASDVGYEAQSSGKLYLKLETGRSYLLAGDYRTDLSENEFSRYDRSLHGVKLEHNGERLSVKGFESRTQETVTKDEIPGNGSSGHYFLSRKPVFENSERVRIEVRDRYHSERVLSVVEKVRYADYSIDYHAGTILFKEPVPSLDQNLNPVSIVVNYQSQGGGEERYVYGGRALWTPAAGAYFGGTAVVEQGAVKDGALYGLDAGVTFGDRISLKGEGAFSDTLVKGRGSAWKTELSARPFDSVGLGAYYRKVEADFFNSSMTGNETGTEKYGGRIDYRGLAGTLIFAESFLQKDELNAGRRFGSQAGFLRKFSLFQGEGGFQRVEEEKGGVKGHSDLIYAGIRAALSARLDATLRRDQLLSPSSVSDYQSKTFLKLDYRITDKTTAFLTEEHQEGSPIIRQATRVGLESQLSDRMRLATGYQASSGAAGSTEQSNVDLNTMLVDRDGFRLDSRSGYQLENALSQRRGQAILGLNSRFRAAEGLYLNSSLERVQTVQGNSGTRTAFTLAGEYLRAQDLKLTGRYEIRSGPGESASLYGAGAAYKVSGSLTLLGKASLWDRDADAGRDRLFDGYLGASFRPLAGSPLQLLALARYKLDDKGSVPGLGESRSLILSAEPTYRMAKNWTAQGKYAGKLSWFSAGGIGYQTYTDLALAGLSYDLAERWELSAYLKLMNQYDTGQHGIGGVAGVGYRVYRNVVLSAGYNYARLDDRDLSGESFQGHGPFFGVKVKFDEDMFDLSQRKVAMLPPPIEPPAAVEEPQAAPRLRPPVVPALLVSAAKFDQPLQLSGSAELLTLLINGEPARLPSTAVTVGRQRHEESVDLRRGRPTAPLDFLTSVERPELVRSWSLNILDGAGRKVRSFAGNGAPKRRINWAGEAKGETEGAAIKEGELYQYQLQVTYLDGSVFRTGIEMFGVNRRQAVLLTLGGGAFIFDSARLTKEAKLLLKGAARVLRAHPQDKVLVEGHTDGIGTARYNMKLSKKRCEAAVEFLVREESIPRSRLIKRWYGKGRPVADNGSIEGRRLNRRVELKGDFQETLPVSPNDRYRGLPFLVVNDRAVPLDPQGRFETSVPAATRSLKVEMGDSLGRSLDTAIPVPALTLVEPVGDKLVHYGSAAWGVRVNEKGVAHCTLSGGAEPGSTLELDGRAVPLDESGWFALELQLDQGEQVFGMVLRNGGCSKLMNVKVLSTRQGPGRLQP